MTLFSLGDKLTERYFILHNFPTCSEKHFIGYATEQRHKSRGREKIFPYGSVNLQASGVFLNARFQLCTDRFACIHMALVNKFILQPLQREK